MATDKNLLPTQVLLQVWMDGETSAVVLYLQQFQQTNEAK